MITLLLAKAIFITVLWQPSAYSETIFKESEESQCGNIFTENQFILTSENYPSPYPTGKTCFYLLKGQKCTTQFNIKFLDFDLKSSIGCTEDRLEIGYQDALCGIESGSRYYKAEKGSLKLKFVANKGLEKSNRGFKVLVTRIDACDPNNTSTSFVDEDAAKTTTDTTQVEWTTKTVQPGPTYLPPLTRQCCQNDAFSLKRFFLVSPNFPYASKFSSDCMYIIKKASPQICRLRINILFFSLGPPIENACPYGHLEIDGKYICGCISDLRLVSNFGNLDSMVIRYHNSGYNTNDFYGFVLEVIQDECAKRYSPDDGVQEGSSSGNFRFYKDQFNRVSWPKDSNIGQSMLVNEKSRWVYPDNNRLQRKLGAIQKHFYFFAPEDEEDVSWIRSTQEKEETNYIEISTINTLLTNSYYYQECIEWNKKQMFFLNRRFGNSLNRMCRSFQPDNIDEANCIVLNSLSGDLESPGYPLDYPSSQNVCYRFKILPGYCAIRMIFNDFQMEESYNCLKDYLSINQYRYCGKFLKNKQVTIDIRGKSYLDLNFVTDANYCGKGFSAVYQQIQCSKTEDPVKHINCNPSDTTTLTSVNCNRLITEKFFVISYEAGANFCSFTLRKNSEDVCKIKLYFERFNLPCGSESILIDGKLYCGQMSGQSVTIDIINEKEIIYRREGLYGANKMDYSGNLLIQGIQINNLCDVCNLIRNNVTIDELPAKICELLTKHGHVADCNILKVDVKEILNKEKNVTNIRLMGRGAEELQYNDIEC